MRTTQMATTPISITTLPANTPASFASSLSRLHRILATLDDAPRVDGRREYLRSNLPFLGLAPTLKTAAFEQAAIAMAAELAAACHRAWLLSTDRARSGTVTLLAPGQDAVVLDIAWLLDDLANRLEPLAAKARPESDISVAWKIAATLSRAFRAPDGEPVAVSGALPSAKSP